MENTPKHVAIIPDGNRRWARQKRLPAVEGHRRGLQQMEKIASEARQLGITTLTVWGFSTENWRREQEEVDYLDKLIISGLERLASRAGRENARISHIGRKDRLSDKLLQTIKDIEADTYNNDGHRLNIALDYGGRDEIVRAIRQIVDSGIASQDITEELISNHLDTQGVPDPDLVIRTSGEYRTSGFLSWQSAYAEYYFSPLYLPDFGPAQFRQAIEEYSQRQRRFGK